MKGIDIDGCNDLLSAPPGLPLLDKPLAERRALLTSLLVDAPAQLTLSPQRLLIRRNRRTGELAYYLCWSATPVPLHALVRVAGSRWSIEELFQTGKGQVGLDHYQVRGWTGWHRFITLAMLALALLTVLAATSTDQADHNRQIPLTVAEIRRLLNAFVLALPLPPAHTLHWSIWRRTSQARARRSHYQHRLRPRQPTGEVTLEY